MFSSQHLFPSPPTPQTRSSRVLIQIFYFHPHLPPKREPLVFSSKHFISNPTYPPNEKISCSRPNILFPSPPTPLKRTSRVLVPTFYFHPPPQTRSSRPLERTRTSRLGGRRVIYFIVRKFHCCYSTKWLADARV